MVQQRQENIGGGELWFGLLGGAVAWTLHLLLAYALGEFGCLSPLGHVQFLGITAVAWGVLLVSIVLIGVAAAATGIAYRNEQRLKSELGEVNDALEGRIPAVYMTRAGWITSGMFLLVILFETVPIFYFLKEC